MHVSQANQELFTGDKGVFKHDKRVRGIPFATNRPTLHEAQDIQAKLSTIVEGKCVCVYVVYDIVSEAAFYQLEWI